ncbi:tetratricopeptide repeat protein [Actinomycetospora rhizophila]|uniref:Tetratricopeptide repeat protein n=1 Tax=Actinomycetospora rhizophila TaxID=1416876 RepID=A0ABV9Z621_9PSEU
MDGQGVQLLELPSKIRDYLAWDSTTDVALAPGPVGPITPQIPAAFPDAEAPATSIAAQVAQLFRPRHQPKINLILVPEVPASGFAVGVQIVRTPGDILIGARSVQAGDLKELTYKVGGFCAEIVLEQPEFSRRAPRWEHWTPQAYTLFRIGLYFQRHDLSEAHDRLTEAAKRCPGNVQVALYHGNVHEKMGQYKKAAEVYDAAACLWTNNIDLIYRLAAAKANFAMTNRRLRVQQRVRLMEDANKSLRYARRRLRKPFVIWSYVITFWPFRRDLGERRYWLSWLIADSSHRSLFRRSKGFELRRALEVAVEANELYLHSIRHDPDDVDKTLAARDSVRNSWIKVRRAVKRSRVGWLTHWTAACYFSRASLLPKELRLEGEWRDDRKNMMRMAETGLGIGGDGEPNSWETYCQERAVGQIGSVVRNPYCQLDFNLLREDPDMKPLRRAFKGRSVAVLAGIDDKLLRESVDIPMQLSWERQGLRKIRREAAQLLLKSMRLSRDDLR